MVDQRVHCESSLTHKVRFRLVSTVHVLVGFFIDPVAFSGTVSRGRFLQSEDKLPGVRDEETAFDEVTDGGHLQ